MNSATHCQLLLPGMRHPAGTLAPSLPALQAMLGYGRREADFAGDAEAWLCRRFAVERQQDWPVAPFAALGAGLAANEGYWLCVRPLHLQLQRDRLVAAGGVPFRLNPAQAQQLVEALNAHFAVDGMRFFAPHAERWYLRLDDVPLLETTPLAAVLGRDVDGLLPRGRDGLRWHARLNEMQMLLHEHPANVELEQSGSLPVNSLWLWGGGTMPAALVPPPAQVWAHDPLACGLASAHGRATQPLPPSALSWMEAAIPGNHLVVLDQLQANAEPQAWQEALQQLERHWFAPLLQLLRQGRLQRLSLYLADARGVTSYDLARADTWKFWRRPRPLETGLG